jgi:hypothetical protein
MVDESNWHRMHVVTEEGPICVFTRWIDVILRKKDFWCQRTRSRGWLFDHNNKTNIVMHFRSIMASDETPTSNLTWPWVAIRKYKTGTIVAGFWIGVEYQRYRWLLLLSTGIHSAWYDQWLKRYNLSKFMNAAGILRWMDLEGTDYFEFLTKIQNENSKNFEYQTRRHLP